MFNNLQTYSNAQFLTPEAQLQLLELQDLELQLEQEERRRRLESETKDTAIISSVEAKHKAFVAAYPFRDFVQESFQIIEPSREFYYNWHIDIIAELLQAVVLGDVRNFIINQPRRTMKSLLSCVMFPCWVWTFLPHLRFLYTSYSKEFAKRDNKACQDLINSDWYQQRFGHVFTLTTQRAELIKNNRGGSRIIFRIGKGVGTGGDFVFADDPNDVEETESETTLEKTNRGYKEVSSQNVQDRRTAARGIVQQRTAPNDLTGHINEDTELKALFDARLCLPNRFEEDHPDINTLENPLRLGRVTEFDKAAEPSLIVGEEKIWIDPRLKNAEDLQNNWYKNWYRKNITEKGINQKGEGALLWPDYLTEKETVVAETLLGNYGTSAQMQQRPVRRGGNFFNSAHFTEIDLASINLNNLVLMRYWDMAGTDNDGDWTVGTLMARTKTRPYKFYILDMFRDQISYLKRMEELKRISREDIENYVLTKQNCDYTVGIEREGGRSGKDISFIEKEELIGFDVWMDFKQVSKESRAKIVRQRAESGYLSVVKNPVWNKIFFKRLEKYDPRLKKAKDDEIDTLGGCLYFLAFMNIQQSGSTGGHY